MATESIWVEGTPLCSVLFSAREKNTVVDPFTVALTVTVTNLTVIHYHIFAFVCVLKVPAEKKSLTTL